MDVLDKLCVLLVSGRSLACPKLVFSGGLKEMLASWWEMH